MSSKDYASEMGGTMSSEVPLDNARCKSLSSEVKQRRWKMLGHTNMMNVAMTRREAKKGKAKNNMA